MLRQQLQTNNWYNGISNHGFIFAATHGRGLFKCETLKGPLYIPPVTSNLNKYSFDISPNPAVNYITLTQNYYQNSEAFIYNIKGELVLNKQIQNSKEIIYINNLPKGIYIIRVTSAKGTNMKKFIKL